MLSLEFVRATFTHLHSIIHIDDYAAAKELIVKLVKASDQTTLATIRENV